MDKSEVFTFLKDKYDKAFVAALESKDPGTVRSYLNKANIINIALMNLIEVL